MTPKTKSPSSQLLSEKNTPGATYFDRRTVPPRLQAPRRERFLDESHDLVHEVEAFRPMRDQEHGAALCRTKHVGDERLGRVGVDVGGRLVEHEDGRIGEE